MYPVLSGGDSMPWHGSNQAPVDKRQAAPPAPDSHEGNLMRHCQSTAVELCAPNPPLPAACFRCHAVPKRPQGLLVKRQPPGK